jgi:hypothetical protein
MIIDMDNNLSYEGIPGVLNKELRKSFEKSLKKMYQQRVKNYLKNRQDDPEVRCYKCKEYFSKSETCVPPWRKKSYNRFCFNCLPKIKRYIIK